MRICAVGGSTWPTNAPRPPSTVTWPPAAPVRSARSCSRSLRPRTGTPRTGSRCWGPTWAVPGRWTCARGCWRSWPVTSAPSSSWPSCSAPRPVRPTTPTTTPRLRWPQTSASTARWCAGWRSAAATGCRGRSARRCSAPTTGWSATSPWSWGSAPAASRTARCCSPEWRGCWRGRCRWGPGSSSQCAPSVNCWGPPPPTPRPSTPWRTWTWTPTS